MCTNTHITCTPSPPQILRNSYVAYCSNTNPNKNIKLVTDCNSGTIRKLLFGINRAIELQKITTSDNTGKLASWNIPRYIPLMSDVAVIQGIHKRMTRFQKLKSLFLTLHGHNIHRQQRQLSKFLMRYQQFAFHAYCRAARSVYKMAPQQEKAFCVLHFEVSRSVITVHCNCTAAL